MKLTYWICHHMTDHSCYSYRARTKRECLDYLNNPNMPEDERKFRQANHSQPKKVEVLYDSAFHLMELCNSEGGLWEENQSREEAFKE